MPLHPPQAHLKLNYLPLLAHSANYPKPALSMLPSANTVQWPPVAAQDVAGDGSGATSEQARVLAAGLETSAFLQGGQRYRLGRYALTEALRRAGAGPGRAVWMPAFHCRTMPEAAQHLGAPVFFYPLTAQLEPDFEALEAMLTTATPQPMGAVAWVQVHYFGFPRAFAQAQAFCMGQGLALVEDCSHAFYGQLNGQALGTLGEFAAASAWKFLPVPEGAVLRDNRATNAVGELHALASSQDQLRSMGLKAELKSARHWLQQRSRPTSMALPEPNAQAQLPLALALLQQQARAQGGEPSAFHAGAVHQRAPRLQWGQIRSAPHARVAMARRSVYQAWLPALEAISGVQAVFAELPPGVVPYAMPVLGDARGLMFHLLKLCGVPVWRWEDMAKQAHTLCPTTAAYRTALLQLPCHQSISPQQLQWMVRCVRQCAEVASSV